MASRYKVFGRIAEAREILPGRWGAALLPGRGRRRMMGWVRCLGCRATREAAQAALDAWARNMGLRPII